MKSRIHLADLCPHCDANDCNIYNSSAEMRRVKMSKVKIMTDSNSGITQDQGRALGVEVVPTSNRQKKKEKEFQSSFSSLHVRTRKESPD